MEGRGEDDDGIGVPGWSLGLFQVQGWKVTPTPAALAPASAGPQLGEGEAEPQPAAGAVWCPRPQPGQGQRKGAVLCRVQSATGSPLTSLCPVCPGVCSWRGEERSEARLPDGPRPARSRPCLLGPVRCTQPGRRTLGSLARAATRKLQPALQWLREQLLYLLLAPRPPSITAGAVTGSQHIEVTGGSANSERALWSSRHCWGAERKAPLTFDLHLSQAVHVALRLQPLPYR